MGIGIQKTNVGICIPASANSVWYRIKKNAGLHCFIPVPELFRYH
jgi:hypothetical protein